jgi:hypothetical protein
LVRRGDQSLQFEKCQACRKGGAFISIHKGMVFADADKVGRCHFKLVGIYGLAAKSCLWRQYGGFQKTGFPDTIAAAVFTEHVLVNRPDLIHVEVDAVIGRFHARFRKVVE